MSHSIRGMFYTSFINHCYYSWRQPYCCSNFLTFPPHNFLRLFICQIRYIYEYKTSKRVFVAISGRSNHRLTVLFRLDLRDAVIYETIIQDIALFSAVERPRLVDKISLCSVQYRSSYIFLSSKSVHTIVLLLVITAVPV